MSVYLHSWESIDNLTQNIQDDAMLTTYIKKSEAYIERTARQPEAYKETPQDFIGRCLWYSWVANKTAYELQYRENIDIPWSDSDCNKKVLDWEEQLSLLSSLQYNIYTNDGNYFLADIWVKGLQTITRIIEKRNKQVEQITLIDKS